MENPSASLLSFGLLLVGLLLILFSAGIKGYFDFLINNKFVRIFVGIIGIILFGVGFVGVYRTIFPTFPSNEISPSLEMPTSALLLPTTTSSQIIPTATQIIINQTPIASDCLSTDYIPEITGFHPPIDTLICVPSGVFVYISSDPARISIPSINYDNSFTTGYTFKFFGPVKFIISGVSTKYIWMEARYDTNLLTKLDEKALNLVYQNGKVCDLSLYTGSACP
jgi:hypothetical protein